MNTNLRRACTATPWLVAAACLTALAGFGPLAPPFGPVTSTAKPLAEVEPRTAINAANTPGDADSVFKITQSGSYYLTGNVAGYMGHHGIEIAAGGVTIDLNGFTLAGFGGDLDGITVSENALRNIIIRNGTVTGWGGDGVDLTFSNTSNCRVEGVTSSDNAGSGIVGGSSITVDGCVCSYNILDGIRLSNGGLVTRSTSSRSGRYGIYVGPGGTISGCTALYNTNDNIRSGGEASILGCTSFGSFAAGINAAYDSVVADCNVNSCATDGILCADACIIRGNLCSLNGYAAGGGAGIHATGFRNRIEANTCTRAPRGIDVDTFGNFITRNLCSANNTNWDVVAGNYLLVVIAAPAGAVTGLSGGATPGSPDPNANYTY